MKRARSVDTLPSRRWRPYHLVLAASALYLIFISFKFQRFLEIATSLSGDEHSFAGLDRPYTDRFPLSIHLENPKPSSGRVKIKPLRYRYGRIVGGSVGNAGNMTELERMADEAWTLGTRAWDEIEDLDPGSEQMNQTSAAAGMEEKFESCPTSVSMDGKDEAAGVDGEKLMFLPCGLSVGSAITIIGRPAEAHEEYVPQLVSSENPDGVVLISQFMVELQGLKAVDGEDPPRILHLNPRLRGDWSHTPVIEHNTCYRMQWGQAMRCNGIPSKDEDDTGIGKFFFFRL